MIAGENMKDCNVLLDGNVNHEWDPGCTCQVGSNVVCRLKQPYVISSMNLLLWEQDDRSYCYYIETSVNEEDWEMMVDFRMEQKSPLQKLRFQPRTVVFIKIVVTNTTPDDQGGKLRLSLISTLKRTELFLDFQRRPLGVSCSR